LAAAIRTQPDLDREDDRDVADQFGKHPFDFLVDSSFLDSELLGQRRKNLPLFLLPILTSSTQAGIVDAGVGEFRDL
jgi:hypothetical protein